MKGRDALLAFFALKYGMGRREVGVSPESSGLHHLLVGVSNQQSIFFRKKPEAEAIPALLGL